MQNIPIQIEPGIFQDSTEYAAKGRWHRGENWRWINGQAVRLGGTKEYSVVDASDTTRQFPPGAANNRVAPHDLRAFTFSNPRNAGDIRVQLFATWTGSVFTVIDSTFVAGQTPVKIAKAYNTGFGLASDRTKRSWSVERAGEDVICCPVSGTPAVYELGVIDPVLMTAKSGALEVSNQNDHMIVSKAHGHIIFGGTKDYTDGDRLPLSTGAYNPRLIRWSDPYTYDFSFQPDQGKRGGFLNMPDPIVCMHQTASSVILIFTETAVYEMRFVGGVEVYRLSVLSIDSGAISKNCAVAVNEDTFWLSNTSFHHSAGTVTELPCPIKYAFFDDLEWSLRDYVFGVHNPAYNEVVWWYPKVGSTKSPNYVLEGKVIFNYETGAWYFGNDTDGKSAVTPEFPGLERPLSVNNEHFFEEECFGDGCSAPAAFLESGPFELGNGEKNMQINSFIPDFETTKTVKVRFTGQQYPQSSETITRPQASDSDYDITPTTEKQDLKFEARQIKMRISMDASTTGNPEARLGTSRIEAQPSGGR